MSNRDEIARLLKENPKLTSKDISQTLHLSKGRVSQIRKALNLPLNRPPKPPLNSGGISTTTPTDYTAVKPSLRLHKLVLSFKLLNPLAPQEPPSIAMRQGRRYAPITMKGHTDALLLDFTLKARLYPTSLSIYAPELEMPLEANLSELLGNAYDQVEAVAWDIEQRLGIKTKKLSKDTLIATINQQHLSLKDAPFAAWMRERHEKLMVPDPDGGEPLLVIDYSHGHDELESENVAKGEFVAQRAKDLLTATAKGEFDYLEVKDLKEIVTGVVQVQASQLQWFQHHDALIVALTEKFNRPSLWNRLRSVFK